MNLKQISGTTLTIVTLFTTMTGSAFAVGPVKQNFQEFKKELKNGNVKAAKNDLQCVNVTAKINLRIQHFKNKRDDHVATYKKMRDRINDVITKLEGKSLDTSKLKSDLQTFDSKVNKLKTDYQTFIAKLEATKQFDCADSQGAFHNALEEAKKQQEIIKADAKDIMNFYSHTIKVDIKNIRQQKPSVTPTP